MEELILTGPINLKRCRMIGEIKIKCPSCKDVELTHNFEESYLSFPEVGDKVHTYFYCDMCDGVWELVHARITKIEIRIAFDPTKIKRCD